MGLTKQYKRYVASGTCNVIASTWPGIVVLDVPSSKGPLVATGACEDVIIWDLRKGEKHMTLKCGGHHTVTVLAKSPDKHHLAVGYKNGSINVFDLTNGDRVLIFEGHKNTVQSLNYSADGFQLVSGGKDTDIVVWDVLNETGLYRLRGHKDEVTQARFVPDKNVIISSSKDGTVKFWDMETNHCFKTLVEHNTEVYDFILSSDLLITGSADQDLRFWRLQENEIAAKKIKLSDPSTDVEDILGAVYLGRIQRKGRGRVVAMSISPDATFFGCHGTNKKLEIFRIVPNDQIEKHLRKREKRLKKRLLNSGEDESQSTAERTLDDEIKNIGSIDMSDRLRSFDFQSVTDGKAKIVALLRNNSLERCEMDLTTGICDGNSQFTMHGHRNEVRTISFSPDGSSFLSGSKESIRVWNRSSLQCFRTIPSGYALCSTFVDEGRRAIVGTKGGSLQIFDIAGGSLAESINGHTADVNAICLAPNKLRMASGGSDKMVILWDLEFSSKKKENERFETRTLSLKAKKKIEARDEVLCIKYSSGMEQKFLAIGCLDNKCYIFYSDTMKMFHTLYGHHQPVTCVDMSDDCSMIATGSGDKDIRIWSMDFGECRKIIKVAHEDKISDLQFIPKTHMFFSCGNDGKVKQWDGDSFELITTLQGHQNFVHSIAISPSGNFLVSAGNDMSIRLWEKSDEILVLDEEKEMAREKEEDEKIREDLKVAGEGDAGAEVGVAGKSTAETQTAMEKLCDALDLYQEEKEKLSEAKKNSPSLPVHQMFQAFGVTTPEEYVCEVLKRTRSSEIEECLLILPFPYAIRLLSLLSTFIESGWEVELSLRCLSFLQRIHIGQILSNQLLQPLFQRLANCQDAVNKKKDMMGFNLAALKFLKQRLEEKDSISLFADAVNKKKNKKKRRAVLTLTT